MKSSLYHFGGERVRSALVLPNAKKPSWIGRLSCFSVGVTGLEMKDLIIAIWGIFRKSPILHTLRWCYFCGLMQKIISFRKNNGQIMDRPLTSLNLFLRRITMNIIEEMYNGNLFPIGTYSNSSKEYKKAMTHLWQLRRSCWTAIRRSGNCLTSIRALRSSLSALTTGRSLWMGLGSGDRWWWRYCDR